MKLKHGFLLLLALLALHIISAQPLDMSLFQNIKPRSIGPAGMSGRVTAIDVVRDNPDLIYLGTASGGLWKSEGGGVAWTPIFDTLKVASIGAIAIDQRNPDVIWVGTGEGNPRNSQTMGAGVYRSLDAGRTWQYMGLERTRTIHRIIIHRDDPNVVYVAAHGTAWGDTPERGVYRTKDGGKTWEKVLFVNNRTGAADFIVDPANPNKMFVNMWEYRRWPWLFKSGGPGSGLYMTLDGGDTWTRLNEKNGLPAGGELGRIGLAIARNNPRVVYALVEAKVNALYRSDDGGFNWRMVNDKTVGDRPFYYCDIEVDPTNENRIYNIFSNVTVSEDGGKTFTTLLGWDNIHGDHHAWYIHPDNPNFIVNGNDGGAAISRDRGKTWQFIANLPVGQFYHVQVDNAIPYNVYGGMQDNGTWRGPSQVWRTGGIRNEYWQEIGFGDGFDVAIDANDERYGYVMWQGGNLLRVDFETGAQQWVKPYHPNNVPLRFNWNAAIATDPFAKGTIYYGSQFLHKSSDNGNSWEIISPDLTTNDPEKQQQKTSGGLTFDVTGAENHTTIIAISPSPRKQGVIWVGTDDGNVQVTQDGGKTWVNVAKNIRGVPAGSWVPQVHASRFNDGEAYVVINNYRRDDWAPYLYRTRDFGATWERLIDINKVWGYALSWAQDPIEPKLQFLGTEFGLYLSIDEGKNWTQWRAGYPTVSTYDMVIHPREQDLVIGTFGRAFYILDDIRPLRELAQKGAKELEKPLKAYPAPDAWLAHYEEGRGTRFTGNAYYMGDNRPYGALLTFSVKDVLKKDDKGQAAKSDTLQVEIFAADGKLVRNLRAPVSKGMNRFAWGLERNSVRTPAEPKPSPDAPVPGGLLVAPGVYKVLFTYGAHKDSTMVNVKADPRLKASPNDIIAFHNAYHDFEKNVTSATQAMDHLREAKARIGDITKLVNEQVTDEQLKKSMMEVNKKTTLLLDTLMLIVMPNESIKGIFDDPDMLMSRLFRAAAYFSPTFGTPNPPFHAPTEGHKIVLQQVKNDVIDFVTKVNRFFSADWKSYEQEVNKLQLNIMKPIPQVMIE
ncbi:MAG TPA: hypothetical protein PKE17_15710 [Saprospiraceae bacterium]|nr:hypothetical protein [Saprospiraceae bacterium]